MKIDAHYFRALLSELIDTDPLCCRAVLSLCRIEFTPTVETLCVSLGQRSILRVNLEFVERNCATEEQVKALILHEFLHVLLGHTTRFKSMTPALNVALDAVINAIIHRTLKAPYSSMMSRYYGESRGLLRLLRPLTDAERHTRSDFYQRRNELTAAEREEHYFLNLHESIYSGVLVSDDILEIARQLQSDLLDELLREGVVLLGGHAGGGTGQDDLDPDVAARVRQALAPLKGEGIWRDPDRMKPSLLKPVPRQESVPVAWRAATLPILRRLILPDPKARRHLSTPVPFSLPVLHQADRRGCLRSLWNPIIPEFSWDGLRQQAGGSVQIYLDVSGSMNAELRLLVSLLAEFIPWIRTPLWAFSTVVSPARIVQGTLQTHSTGGTALACVFEHLGKTRPVKVLIITDGFVEQDAVASFPCRIEALIPHKGTPDVLQKYGIPVQQLPPL
jgi:hypothetical protein